MSTRKWVAFAAAGLLSLAAIPAVSLAKPAVKHVTVMAHKPLVAKTVAKKPVIQTAAHKKVAKKVVKKGAAKTVAHKHGKKTAVKHPAHKHAIVAPKAAAHKTIAKKTATTPHAM